MPRTRASGLALALLAGTMAGCSVDLQPPEGAQITCGSSSECPPGTVCHAGHCVKGENIGSPPDLAGLPVVSPPVGKVATEFTIDLEATKPLAAPPTLTLGLVPPEEVPCASAGGNRYRCTYRATGDENGGLGGVVGFDLSMRDQAQTTTVRNLVGALHLDFAPPVLRLATAAYLPSGTNPLPTVSRATAGTVVVVTVAADELLDVVTPPVLEARSGGTTLPFSLVPGSLDANAAAFEATVPAGLPDGDYVMQVTWSDQVGNLDTADVVSPPIRVKTSIPTLAVDQALVTFVRAPWGVADVGTMITSPAVPAGQVFAALAPGDPLSPATGPRGPTSPEPRRPARGNAVRWPTTRAGA
jgi:hypothetical protein